MVWVGLGGQGSLDSLSSVGGQVIPHPLAPPQPLRALPLPAPTQSPSPLPCPPSSLLHWLEKKVQSSDFFTDVTSVKVPDIFFSYKQRALL